MPVTEGDLLDVLRVALADFGHGNYAKVIKRLADAPDGGGEMGRALRLASEGLHWESTEPLRAGRLMEESLALGVAVPVLLTEQARFFKRHDRHALAYATLTAREVVAGDRLERFVDDLPEHERARYAPWTLNASPWVERQSYYSTISYKRALRERYGPEAAALLLEQMRAQGRQRVVARRPLLSLMEYAQSVGSDYEEVIAKQALPPGQIEVHGEGADIEFAPSSRSMFTCTLDDIVVSGKSNFLLTPQAALLDFQDDELSRRVQDLSLDPLIASNDDDSVLVFEEPDRDALRHIPEAIWLSGAHSRAFGHWMMEFLPKLWALMLRPGFESVPIIVDDEMPSQHIEAIQTFSHQAHPLIVLERHESVRVERLWVSSLLQYKALGAVGGATERTRSGIDAAGLHQLVSRIQPVLEAIDTGGAAKRVYLARKPFQHRKLSNAMDVEPVMQGHGFERHEFNALTFRQQLRIIRGADHIVGPAGSALTMTIFGRPGLDIGVLAGAGHPDSHWLSQVSRALDHRLVVVFGDIGKENQLHRSKSDYAIDLDVLAEYLEGHGAPPGERDASP